MKGYAGERGRVLIVDGYNVINVRKPVRESRGLEDARRKLTDRLHDYAGWSGQRIVLVYDAWLSDRAQRSVETRGSLEVVFTKKGETADQYIERLCDELSDDVEMRRIELRVATSDLVEQTIAFGRGAIRLSSRELLMEMDMASALRGPATRTSGPRGTTVGERLPADIREKLERMRRGEGILQSAEAAPERGKVAPDPDRNRTTPEPGERGPAPQAKRGEPVTGAERGGAKPGAKRKRGGRRPGAKQEPRTSPDKPGKRQTQAKSAGKRSLAGEEARGAPRKTAAPKPKDTLPPRRTKRGRGAQPREEQ